MLSVLRAIGRETYPGFKEIHLFYRISDVLYGPYREGKISGCEDRVCWPVRGETKRGETRSVRGFTLTFEEVGSVLEGLGIKIEEAQPFSVLFNAVREAHGFAQSGGVINAVKVYLKDENVNAVQVANLTKKNVALLRAYAKTGKAPAQFIEVMACEGGCVTGPCTHADKTAGQKQLIKELTKF